MIHTNLPQNCVVFLLLCELTWSASYVSQKSDSHKWPTVVIDEVKGKPCNFEALFVWIIVFFFYNIFLLKKFSTRQKCLYRICIHIKCEQGFSLGARSCLLSLGYHNSPNYFVIVCIWGELR